MKKILFLLAILIALASCSKDSYDELSANYIEVNGNRLQVNYLNIYGGYFAIGSYENNHINAIGVHYKDSFSDIDYNKKVYFSDAIDCIEFVDVIKENMSYQYQNLKEFSSDSYYCIEKEGNGTYRVDVNIKTSQHSVKIKYLGKRDN